MSDLYEQDLMDYLDYHWQKVVMVEAQIHKAVKVANGVIYER